MPFYDIRGYRVYAAERGPENRQVALLIHGWSSSWYAMSPLMDLLSQRFRCMAVDLPGYGQSPRLPMRTTIPDYADILADLLAKVTDKPAVLVGHSMGGMTSITMALRHPERVERMVLLGPTITGKLSAYINLVVSPITLMERFGFGSLIISFFENIIVGISDRVMRPASFAERTGITEEDYRRLREDARRPGQGQVRAECYFAMRANDLSDQLKDVEHPTLIIWGAEDNTVPLRDAGVVADEWPEADLRIFPKAGHWPQFEAPKATHRLLAGYLGLSLSRDKVHAPVADEDLLQTREVAQFLANSDVGHKLNQAQRLRLAAQCEPRAYAPGEVVVRINDPGNEFYVIRSGTVEVWSDPNRPGEREGVEPQHTADLVPGQLTGELSVFDHGLRSAELRAGPDGATILMLHRDRILALCEDDGVLGTQLLWNISTALAQRVRFVIWQLQRAVRDLAANHPPPEAVSASPQEAEDASSQNT